MMEKTQILDVFNCFIYFWCKEICTRTLVLAYSFKRIANGYICEVKNTKKPIRKRTTAQAACPHKKIDRLITFYHSNSV